MPNRIRVTVRRESVHERENPIVAQVYPEGMHSCIAEDLREDAGLDVRPATLQETEHGLTKSVLEKTEMDGEPFAIPVPHEIVFSLLV